MSEITLRELRGDDIFSVLALMDTLEIVEPIEKLVTGDKRKEILDGLQNTEASNEEIGMIIASELAKIVIKRLPKARNEVNQFLADLAETDVETIANLPLIEYIKLVKSFFTHNDLAQLWEYVQELMPSE